ncbi:membrane protein required for colicin V production [Chitinivorax tropicus]|uniref:Membrane protein required for colicin V production n=1 Tax=Chitinivorax tropicus TaxID=714531 RepID=A0A840MPW9_9PROT|nr:CvpA family protein [Chitinivorax tropicus]MBB5018792.1 membrane protein required for colicin V production [Chitinivorax tropicus]
MTPFDYGVLLIVGFSVLLSVMRGLLRELMALASWVIAFFVARNYTTEITPLLPASIPSEELKLLAGFLALFLGSLLIMTLLTIALSEVIKVVGLSGVDRILGALFGLVRGCFIVVVLVLLAGLTSLPREPMWKNAMFSPVFEAVALVVKPWLPDGLAKHIKYE